MVIFNATLTRRRLFKMMGIVAGSRALPAFADVIAGSKQTTRNTSTLFYKPASATLYDTWIFHHHRTFFMYYLSAPSPEGRLDSIAMATSLDGVHWKEHGRIIEAASEVSWIGDG